MKIRTADYIAEFFVKNGINDCFMITGGGAMHLNDAIGHCGGIKCFFNHHEQASAIAAESYARLTGRIAAVCVTSGPGGTNAITGVMGGWVDSIPMFIISGQVKRETTMSACPEINLRQLGDQEFDIINSVSNMTKYAIMLTNPIETAYHLEKALYLAMNGRKGPVWLDIPLDVQGAVIETEDLIHFDPKTEVFWDIPEVTDKLADDILEKIRNAKAPLILAGTGIRMGDAEETFLKVVEKLNIPVSVSWNASDTIAYENPHFVGMSGTVGSRSGNFAVQNCDLIISLGCRLNIRMIGYNHYDFAKNAYKIIVDIDPNELAKPTVRADMPINADVKDLLEKLLERPYTPPTNHESWLKWCKNLAEKYPVLEKSYYNDGKGLMNPYVFIDKLYEQFDASDKIVCGNGSACIITNQCGKIKQGQRMYANSGCATMGYALPAAVGAAVAVDGRRIVCIDGDGSLMMNLQELAVIAHNRLNIKLFLINNNGYHSIRQTQSNNFKPPFVGIDSDSGVGFPDFRKLAEAFGIRYLRIESEKDCSEIIRDALSGSEPCFCEAIVDPNQNFAPKSSSKLLPDGRIVSTSIDDMAPFLPKEEFESIKYLK